ncbi:FecR family protein [Fulvivirgaceae bacterium BMA10]|uniref:FecR family protein n=1 Tax=Splendidivirga corallicola TaxID=3051826 RepID=A0ABT8KXA4_9BACT|nr:FecR family protein [Fulvivirgaceae bacterium BMA10]
MPKLSDYTLEDFLVDESFQRFVRENSDTDRVIWEEYLRLHPEKEATLLEAKKIIDQLYIKIPQKEFQYELEKFRSIVEANKINVPKERSSNRFKRYGIAAFVSVILLTTVFFGLKNYSSYSESKVISLVERTTERGRKSNLLLKDSTRIKLNAQTTIKYAETFKDDIREVQLIGEAFFDVKEDKERPFIVHVGDVSIKVLGTSFNVRAYPEENTLSVSLVTGKVEILKNGHIELTLTPNYEATLTKSSDHLIKSLFDPKLKLAWKDDIIRFEKASFAEIVTVLERWYDVDFIYDKDIDVEGFTGEFTRMSLENLLKGMSHSVGFDFKIEGRKVWILTK